MSESPAAGAKAVRALAAKLKKQWRKANAGDAAAALVAHPELAAHPSVAADLAYEEYLLLEKAGAAPGPASFAARFPACRSVVHSVIAMHRRLTEEPELLDAAAWPQPGETIDDVELTALLGEGAFGRAYLGYQPGTDRACVLKLTAGPSAEARVIGKLDHKHVTKVYWAKEIDGRSAVCMPLVGANTLDEVIAAAFPSDRPAAPTADVILTVAGADDDAPEDEVVRAGEPYLVGAAAVAACVARAVAYVHGQGVAHGDLKPLNVVIGRGGSPLLIDFNLSSRSDGPAAVRGTPGYLAPELLEAADPLATTADPKRADLFALAVLVTELLTGRRPFPPADPKSFAAQAVAARTPPVIAATVPARVAAVLRACLSPDPAARPASAAVLAAALDRVVTAARSPRRWWRWAAAAALLVIVPVVYGLMRPPAPVPTQPVFQGTAGEYFARGWEKKKAEDWADAALDFLKSHELSPNNWAVSLAAYCESQAGKHDDAIGHAGWVDRKMAGGAPPDVLNVIGFSQFQLSRDRLALPPLDRLLAREPFHAAGRYNRAQAWSRLKENPAGAADDMRVVLSAAGSASPVLHYDAARAFVAASDGDPERRREALDHVRAAIGMGAFGSSLRGDTTLRAPFAGGFGSRLAFESACAAPRGPAPGKQPGLRLVEPRPF